VCHYCESAMLTGEVTYKVQPLEPPGESRVLMCCTEPRTEVTLEL
jgi:hypothetical protein